jgi:hypothetical protein
MTTGIRKRAQGTEHAVGPDPDSRRSPKCRQASMGFPWCRAGRAFWTRAVGRSNEEREHGFQLNDARTGPPSMTGRNARKKMTTQARHEPRPEYF